MYKEIKIDKEAVTETRGRLKKQRDRLQSLKNKSRKLTFYEKGIHASTGPCAQSMESVTKNIPLVIDALDQLILTTDAFLEDAEKKFSNLDKEVSNKY